MKIINEKPPIYDMIVQSGMTPSPHTIYAYGDAIYNPGGFDLETKENEHYIVHESVHCRQQGDNPDYWWSRYLDDHFFRIQMEIEAYAEQYDFICKTNKDRNQRFKILHNMARILASPIYGNVIGQQSALQLIKNQAKTK